MSEDKQIEFSEEQESKLVEELKKDWFNDLNSKVNMYDEEATIEEKIEHIKKYIMYYCKSSYNDIKETVENFFDLLEHYEAKKYREPVRNENGVINLLYSGFNSGNAFYTGKMKAIKTTKGAYTEGIYITPDRKEYIKKLAMDSKGQMNGFKHHQQLRYNGVIANQVFEFFGEKSATYLPAIKTPPYYYVISENFLSKDQELITLDDLYCDEEMEYTKHSSILKLLEDNMKIRYKNIMDENKFNNLIKKLKLQYSKQEFIKKIIGLRDEKIENMGIVLTTNGEEMEVPQIDISPAFDLDMSFDIAEETKMVKFQTDNGKTDIKSFIEEFREIEGFTEFLSSIVNKIKNEDEVIQEIIDKSYEISKAKYFKDESNRRDYSNYLKARFKETKQAFNELYLKDYREGEEK